MIESFSFAFSYSAFHFIRPAWFFALLPAVALLIYLFRQRVLAQRLDRLGDPRLVGHLVLDEHKSSHNGLFWLLGLLGFGWLFAIVAMAGPVWEKQPQPVYRASAARVIILDLSTSMNTKDLQPSRLTRARFKLEDILKQSREGQTALIVFSGEPHVVTPLTDDAATISAMLPALTVDIMPAPGNRLAPALISAQKLFQRASVKSGEILLLTDGVDDVSETISTINRLRQNGIRLSVMGLGTATLDERVLREFARSGGGLYRRLSADDADINALLTTLDVDLTASSQQEQDFDLWIEQGVWLTLPLLLLTALGFRRGLLLWMVMIIVPQPEMAYAFEWADLWTRSDQRAAQILDSGDAAAAAKQFKDPQWQAAAQYQANDYENAEESYRSLNSDGSHYNHANSLARLGKLEDAITAYDQVLEQNPAHEDAKFNRQLIQQLLEQQEQQQSSESDQGDQSDEGEKSQSEDDSQQSDQQQSEQSAEDSKESAEEDVSSTAQEDDPKDKSSEKAEQNKQEESDQQSEEQSQQQSEQQAKASSEDVKSESDLALEQWLRQIPDDPSGLLRRKFMLEHLQRQRGQAQ